MGTSHALARVVLVDARRHLGSARAIAGTDALGALLLSPYAARTAIAGILEAKAASSGSTSAKGSFGLPSSGTALGPPTTRMTPVDGQESIVSILTRRSANPYG